MTAPAPVPDPLAFDALLSRSWKLLQRNWNVLLPPLIALGAVVLAVLAFVLIAIFTLAGNIRHLDRPSDGAIAALVGGYLLLIVGMIVIGLWATIAMYGMADAAWTRGTSTLADGTAAFRHRFGPMLVAYVGLFGVALAALILVLPTLFLSLLAMPILTMYVVPSVVSGGRGGFEAIGESFRLVRRFILPSLIAYLVLFGIQYAISTVAGISILPLEFSVLPSLGENTFHMPAIPMIAASGLGFLVAMAAAFAYNGFYTIALVGLYRNLVTQPEPPPAAVLPPPGTGAGGSISPAGWS